MLDRIKLVVGGFLKTISSYVVSRLDEFNSWVALAIAAMLVFLPGKFIALLLWLVVAVLFFVPQFNLTAVVRWFRG